MDASFLSRPRIGIIAKLSAPIVLTMLSQNLMGVIDTLMIGRLGTTALAGVGLAGQEFFLLFSLMMGLSAAVQSMTARRLGEGRSDDTPAILNGGLLVGALIGLFVLAVGYALMPTLLQWIGKDPAIVASGVPYLYALLPSALTGGLAMAFAGYWLGLGKPMLGLAVVLVQLICNTLFNYSLIFGNFGCPQLGTAGAGLGTSLANVVGLLLHFKFALTRVNKSALLRQLPEKDSMLSLLRIAAPTSTQQFLFALGTVLFFAIVSLLGTQTLAAFNVVLVIMLTLLLLSAALGSAATTLVGRSIGERKINQAKQWGWEVATLGFGLFVVVAGVMIFEAEPILKAFIVEEETRKIAKLPLIIMASTLCIEGFGRILSMSLVGAGAAPLVLQVSFMNQWLMRLPFYWLIGIYFEQGLPGIFLTMMVAYIIQTLTFAHIWRRGRWSAVKL